MRQLYIRQTPGLLNGIRPVLSADHETLYLLSGQFGWSRAQMSASTPTGAVLAEAKQLSLGIMPKFALYYNGKEVGAVVRSIGFWREVVYIRGLNWVVMGNLASGKYKIYHGTHVVASMRPVTGDDGAYDQLSVNNHSAEPVCLLIAAIMNRWANQHARRLTHNRNLRLAREPKALRPEYREK
ncbi:LURP-one-related/scramblase family protein [Furfurilactobacillus sp. WILCCON 0119]|uniref:LURP-one-related/scramblase family protein n=1 Tax=Furfurilactobacillus entadae TaxID=2922307 RepID=UPI0035ECC9C2